MENRRGSSVPIISDDQGDPFPLLLRLSGGDVRTLYMYVMYVCDNIAAKICLLLKPANFVLGAMYVCMYLCR